MNRKLLFCLLVVLCSQVCVTFGSAETGLHSIKLQYNREDACKRLGYDPDFRILLDARESQDDLHPTILIHGWGDDGSGYEGSMNAAGMACHGSVYFNLPDSDLRFPAYSYARVNPFFKALRRSSLGQWSDIAPVLYILKYWAGFNINGVDLCGMSRGGAIVLNMLAILKTARYQRNLNALGIDDQVRRKIIAMIEHGCITIDVPLKSVPVAIRSAVKGIRKAVGKRIARFLPRVLRPEIIDAVQPAADRCGFLCRMYRSWCRLVGNGFDRAVASVVNYVVLPLITRYRPWREQAIDSANELSGMDLKILLNYEQGDTMVTPWGNNQLYRSLRNNHEHTYCLVSHDGDAVVPAHIAPRIQLPAVVHAFKRVFGYTNDQVTEQDARGRLSRYCSDVQDVQDI